MRWRWTMELGKREMRDEVEVDSGIGEERNER